MGDSIEKFRKALLSKQRSDLHKQYFAKDETLESVSINIVTEQGSKLIPFRNKGCLTAKCIYDINEILEKYKDGENNDNLQFACKHCDTNIKIKNFQFDTTLATEVNKIWEKAGNNEFPKVTEIKQFKDGHCESQQADSSDSLDNTKDLLNLERKPSSGVANQQILKDKIPSTEIEDSEASKIPKISDFNKREFSHLFNKFSAGKKNNMNKKAQPLGIDITKEEIDSTVNDLSTSPSIMAFFVRYIQNNAKPNDVIFPFTVESYDKYDQRISFTYLQTFKNDQKQLLKGAEPIRIFLIYKYDERWISAYLNTKYKKCMIFDFLAPDLCKTSKEELQGLTKAFLTKELQLKTGAVGFYERAKSQSYSDCGLYVCKFLSNSLVNGSDPEKQSVSDSERNTMRTLIPWLILKLHYKESSSPEQPESFKDFLDDKGEGSVERKSPKVINLGMRSYLEVRNQKPKKPPRTQVALMLSRENSITESQSLMRENSNLLDNISIIESQNKKLFTQEDTSEEEKTKLPRPRNLETLKDLKSESPLYRKRDTLNLQEEEGLFDYSKVTRKDVTNPQVRKILQEARRLKVFKLEVVTFQQDIKTDNGKSNEYLKKYNEYAKAVAEFYTLLAAFKVNCPELYEKVARELCELFDKDLLMKFNLLQYKNSSPVSKNTSAILVSPEQSFSKKLPPVKNLQKETSLRKVKSLTNSQDVSSLIKKREPIGNKPPSRMSPKVKTKREVAAKRYGTCIFTDEIANLKENDKLSKSIFVFFFGYLQEKQAIIPQEELVATKTRILSFGPQFYARLTDKNLDAKTINYDNVKDLTMEYQGEGSTIFDVFDKVIMAVKGKEKRYSLVLIDNIERRINLFDPSGQTDQSPVNNPIICNISQFIEMEYKSKANVEVNLARWRFIYGGTSKLQNPNTSGLLVAKIVHSMYMGSLQGHYKQDDISEFKKKLIGLIEAIGVTKNYQGELGSYDKYQL